MGPVEPGRGGRVLPHECAAAREMISAAFDGELDAAETARLAHHLDRCHHCRIHRAQLRALALRVGEAAAALSAEEEGYRSGAEAAFEEARRLRRLEGRRRHPRCYVAVRAVPAAAMSVLCAVFLATGSFNAGASTYPNVSSPCTAHLHAASAAVVAHDLGLRR